MNVGDWTYKRALYRPEHLFLKDDRVRLSNLDFNRKVNQMARALTDLGVGRGDRVATLLSNCSEFLELFFAVAKLGAIFAPLGAGSSVTDVGFVLEDCQPKLLVHHPEAESKLEAVSRPGTRNIVLDRVKRGAGSLCQMADQASVAEPDTVNMVGRDDRLVIFYIPTPGGLRGAVQSHQNIIFGAIHSILGLEMNQGYRSMVIAPMSQIASLTASALCVVYAGGSLVIRDFYSPSEILELMEKEDVNFIFAVPVMFQMLTKAPEWPQADFSRLHHVMSGGAPMPVELIRKYQQEKAVRFPQGYGMSETGRLTALGIDEAERKAGSVGKEVFHLSLRLVDDDGKDVPTGEIGEIIVRGPNVFEGYWNRPEDNKAVFKEGWFQTADLGRRDEEGFIYLEGRKIETINASGLNVYPAEVARAIMGIPGVKEAVVVGLSVPAKGQIVGAAIVPQADTDMKKETIQEALKDKLAAHKIPKRIVFIQELPKLPPGFVDKQKVKEILGGKESGN